MILVTGAGGTIGGYTARILAGEGHAVRLLTRDRARLGPPPGGCEVAVGDYADADSLRKAVVGVDAVLAVTNDPRSAADDERLAGAAREAGVRRLVKLSGLGVTDAGAQDRITAWQRETEEVVRASGLEWTLLRPRAFMSNTLSWAASVRESATVRTWPADVPAACVDPRDVAAVAAAALTGAGHAGAAYALTGPEPLTARERTDIVARVLDRPLRFEEEPADRVRAGHARRYGGELADALLAVAARRSEVDPTLPGLLGRPAGGFADWVRDHAHHFGPGE
ncbi:MULTISPECIES: SDR family oxidoreductase [unclassified Streptomyces]|uniref:SDR family oxidoreductase n=1 Tax=unclassified Streptomyces TaxID=2593676 RepID=UPI00278C60EC|nr:MULTISPECIES: NAD(P)H-binding protein [unclassified Streptomyces]